MSPFIPLGDHTSVRASGWDHCSGHQQIQKPRRVFGCLVELGQRPFRVGQDKRGFWGALEPWGHVYDQNYSETASVPQETKRMPPVETALS